MSSALVRWLALAGGVSVLALSPRAKADVFNMADPNLTSLQFVSVGQPGNAADPLTGHGAGPARKPTATKCPAGSTN